LETIDPEDVLISKYVSPYSGPTLDRYYAVMFDWLAWCIQARVHILDVKRFHIEQWAKNLKVAEHNKASTIGGKLTVVCGFYQWAFEEGLIDHDPAAFVRRPSRPRRSNKRWLSKEQAAELLEASKKFGPPWSGFFHLTLLNGLRHAETLEARIQHLGHVEDYTVLRLPARKKGVMDDVSLPEPTVEVLKECIGARKKGYILVKDKRRLKQSQVYAACNQISEACQLDFQVRPHMLRATFVTLSLDAGAPIRDVMASMGVADSSMVHYYDRAHASIRRNTSRTLAQYLTT
jgi:Site-specific recombinase XerD